MTRDVRMLARTVGRNRFDNPFLFGGGTMKILDDVSRMTKSAAAGGEIGTITPAGKAGNPGPNIFYAHFVKGVLMYTLNSLGLPNPGKDGVSNWARTAVQMAHDCGKLIGINIAADTPEEIIEMVLWALEFKFDWITINGGCPNKYGEDKKPLAILGFDEPTIERLFEMLDERIGPIIDIWWKPPPYTDTVGALVRTAKMVARSKSITGYIANNTVAHCFHWGEDGKPAITPGGGLAGMGGPAVKPISEGHLRIVDGILPPRIARIGAGGVTYGVDVGDYIRTGAQLVHATSVVWAYPDSRGLGYGEANRILGELMDVPDLEALCAAT